MASLVRLLPVRHLSRTGFNEDGLTFQKTETGKIGRNFEHGIYEQFRSQACPVDTKGELFQTSQKLNASDISFSFSFLDSQVVNRSEQRKRFNSVKFEGEL